MMQRHVGILHSNPQKQNTYYREKTKAESLGHLVEKDKKKKAGTNGARMSTL